MFRIFMTWALAFSAVFAVAAGIAISNDVRPTPAPLAAPVVATTLGPPAGGLVPVALPDGEKATVDVGLGTTTAPERLEVAEFGGDWLPAEQAAEEFQSAADKAGPLPTAEVVLRAVGIGLVLGFGLALFLGFFAFALA